METVPKDIKQHGKAVSNPEEIKSIAERYAAVKNYVFSRYSGINSLNILNTYKKHIRDVWVKSKFADQWSLPARYWKCALDEAISNIKSEWSNTKLRINKAVKHNPNLTENEKLFIYYVLKADPILHAVLTYRNFAKPEKITALNIREKYILNLIRRYVRKYKGTIPRSMKKRSFMIDAPMYRYKTVDGENILEIAGLKRNNRINIALKDKNIHTGNLRIVIEDDGSVTVHRLKHIKVKENNCPENILGIDKGYTSLFAASSGRFYGDKLNEFLTDETERLNSVNAKRNRIWALMKRYRSEGLDKKADIILRNNFGKVKYNRNKQRFDTAVKSYINHTIKIMLDEEKPTELILEDLSFKGWSGKLPKHIKRKLSRWIKGYIQKRIEYISSLRQVKVTLVNPAYTSQICHICSAFGQRDGRTFTCSDCGTMDADYNASCNIMSRRDDREITLYTAREKVKEILIKRYESRLAV